MICACFEFVRLRISDWAELSLDHVPCKTMEAVNVVIVLLLLSCVDGKVDDATFCVVPATVHVRQNDTCYSLSEITRHAVNWAGMKGEQEAIQLLVEGIPPAENMTKYLSIEFSDLTQEFGVGQITKDAIQWWQVGYVNCKETTRYPGSGGGWRPDPLLMPTDNKIILEANVTQPLWLTIHIPSTAIAGQYIGTVMVTTQGNGEETVTVISIYLVVWDITLPTLKSAKFSSAFAFDTNTLKNYYGNVDTMKFNYYNMLVDQRIANNDIYQAIPSADEDYKYLYSAGVQYMGLVDVNAVQVSSDSGEGRLRGTCKNYTDDEVSKIIKYLEPYVDKYDKLGYLGNMFVYGFDEVAEDCIGSITKMYGGIKSKWPNLTTMAAINFIPPATLPLDVWVLQYEFYDREKTAAWVKSGKKQWWYHCIEPSKDAYLNSFIERPLMEIRLLYWLASGEPVDGWLYYAIDLWRRVPSTNATLQRLDNTARTDFDPANFIWYPDTSIFANGDGYFIYPGPDGPIPTVRLHNFRDGFEDIELLRMLDLNTTQQLVQPLVRSPTDFTLDPYLLELTRKKAAALVMKNLQ